MRSARTKTGWWALIGAAASINVLLLVPIVVRFQAVPLTWVAVEAILLPALFALLPRQRWSRWAAGLAAAVVVLAFVLGLAEAATWGLLLRPLNVYLDFRLLAFAHELLVTNVGRVVTLVLEGTAVLAGVGIWLVLTWCLVRARGLVRASSARLAAAVVATAACAAILSPVVLSYWPSAFAPTGRHVREQMQRFLETRRELQTFAGELARSESRARPMPALAGVDVILAFIESYGVSVHRDERYAKPVQPALDALAAATEAAGASVVTGKLRSPVQGGQSWLAHGTTLSGLWLDSQIRYDLLLENRAPTLIDDFRATGHKAVGVFPAITRPWPDGERLGYDAVHSAPSIDYRGPRLNWVTMPDQFTWSWFQRQVREPSERPIFAELALISSHAPWTPVVPVFSDWERVRGGAIFERWRNAGPAPSRLWRDQQEVRLQFARSMRYALSVAAGYTRRYVDEDTLLILLGDHQPAPVITGDDASKAVPVHVISGDDSLLRVFRERGFRGGVALPVDRQTARLSALRGWLAEGYGGSTKGQ